MMRIHIDTDVAIEVSSAENTINFLAENEDGGQIFGKMDRDQARNLVAWLIDFLMETSDEIAEDTDTEEIPF
jgi:hypothetical protein